MDYKNAMVDLPKTQEFLIGFDSDGCVFDTMEIKHKECFCPAFIKHFGLQPVSKYAREVWEFVNLYSKLRGTNRFVALQNALRYIEKRPECIERGVGNLARPGLDKWLQVENKLSNSALRERIEKTEEQDLYDIFAWSEEVNERVADMVSGIPYFPGVEQVLRRASQQADMIVVSQTPLEALAREWKQNQIDTYIKLFCGQEHGTKTDHIQYCAQNKYESDKILMVGDALGDLKAARENGVLFFPIVCGAEEASWQQFLEEGLDKFFAGTYRGGYQDSLLKNFERALPETPPWNQ